MVTRHTIYPKSTCHVILPDGCCRRVDTTSHVTGRTNHTDLAMLPKGEWPKWCKTCGGSGLGYCSRCLGTGEYRYLMGFHFMKMETDHSQDQTKRPIPEKPKRLTAADLLSSHTSSESEKQ